MSEKKARNPGFSLKICLVAFLCICFAVGGYFCGKQGLFDGNNGNDRISLSYSDYMQGIDYGDVTYIIGHKSPDTDTVISAITYSTLKNQLGIHCEPVISGKINNETKFVLEYFGVPLPETLTDATGKNIILVDHSAYSQSIDGMENASIVELIDHHGLGNVTTGAPLYMRGMAVGSTATIVDALYMENQITPDKTTAGLLVSAILSDTVGLTSTTTTDADRKAIDRLAPIAGIKDVNAYFAEMREYAESYEGMTEEEIFYSDYKEYEMSGKKIGIACVNAREGESESMRVRMSAVMEEIHPTQDMDDLYTMIFDSKSNESVLLYFGEGTESIVQTAFGEKCEEGIVNLQNAGSRKRDVVPALQEAYLTQK